MQEALDAKTLALFNAIPAGTEGVQLYADGSSPAWIERLTNDGRIIHAICDDANGTYYVSVYANGNDPSVDEPTADYDTADPAEALRLLLA